MSEHTPEPCGCEVHMTYRVGDDVTEIADFRIRYCPTHAAAFENARLVEEFKQSERLLEEEYRGTIERLAAKNADLLAALEEIRNGRIPQVCEMYEICDHVGCRASYAAFAIADAAIAKATSAPRVPLEHPDGEPADGNYARDQQEDGE